MDDVFKSRIASILLIALFIFTPVSMYYNVELALVILFFLISIPFWLFLIMKQNGFRYHEIIFLWLFYIIISFISTAIFQLTTPDSFRGIFYEVMLFLSIYPIADCCDKEYFFLFFRNIILLLAIVSLFSQLTHWDPFYNMRSRAMLTGIDLTSGGGISSLFEYRHYYAMFLVSSIIITWIKPVKNLFLDVLINLILIVNLLLTYTRNAWIAFIVLLILFFIKKLPNFDYKFNIRSYLAFILSIVLIICLFLFFHNNVIEMFSNIENRFNQVLVDSHQYGGASGVRGYVINNGVKYFLQNWKKYILIGGGNGFALQWLQHNPYGITITWTAAIDVQYVTTLMNVGLLGLSALIGILYLNVKEFFVNSNKNIILSSIFVVFAIMFWFFDVIPFMSSVFVFWTICICLTVKKKDDKNLFNTSINNRNFNRQT